VVPAAALQVAYGTAATTTNRMMPTATAPAIRLAMPVCGAQRSASGGGSPPLRATSEKSRLNKMRQSPRSHEKASRELGYAPRGLEEGLRQTLAGDDRFPDPTPA